MGEHVQAGDGEAARPMWALLMGGPDDLARERLSSPHGKAHEAAVLAALALLRATFERDQAAAVVLSAGSGVRRCLCRLSVTLLCDVVGAGPVHL